MREALARSDHDFVVAEPRRRKAQRRSGGLLGFLAALVRFTFKLAAYPNRILGGLVLAITVAILVNALLLQHSRHPAPLFQRTVTLPDEAPAAAPPPAASNPAPAPAKPAQADPPAVPAHPKDAIGQLLKTDPAPAANQAKAEAPKAAHHHAHEATEAKPQSNDAITQLLKADAPAEERPKTVLGVQQALVKLGFVVRPDGHMGSVTRHALEQYQRDHGLTVDAKLSPKLLHRLAAETGIAIE